MESETRGSMNESTRARTSAVWLTAEQAAAHANVSAKTILREARIGRLRGYRIAAGRVWRFRADDIDAWIVAADTPVAA